VSPKGFVDSLCTGYYVERSRSAPFFGDRNFWISVD